MKSILASIRGPKIEVILADGSKHPLIDYLLPSAIFSIAALLLVVSTFMPYWSMKMTAPQYPRGLRVDIFVNRLEGDIKEIDALNHYLGMAPLDSGGQLERSIAAAAILAIGLLLTASVFVHSKWATLVVLPALMYPFIFVADLFYILYQFGHSVDPKSALGGAIQPFTPALIGASKIGQFGTFASFEMGFYISLLAIVVIVIGLYFHRRAYKPAAEARQKILEQKAGKTKSGAVKI
ncbi:MAG: hypothetical protein BroJett039_02390 [Chloroflexota bacterium]|nr:MAG: hypothetical protein BroJett039_02390 [Chloroflexota bacterium]